MNFDQTWSITLRAALLIIEAEESQVITSAFLEAGVEIVNARTFGELEQLIADDPIDLIVADFAFPELSPAALNRIFNQKAIPLLPFLIFLVEAESQGQAVQALGNQHGDFIVRPISAGSIKARLSVAQRIINSIGRLERIQWETNSIALYDGLTGVYNRQAIYDQVLAEVSRASREKSLLSIAMIEVVNLSSIEEEFGAEIRDQVFRYVTSSVRANVRIYDLLGRWIGPKLLLALPNTGLEDALNVIDRVQKSIQAIGIETPNQRRITPIVHFGVTCTRLHQESPLYILVEQANTALNEANQQNVKQVVLFQS